MTATQGMNGRLAPPAATHPSLPPHAHENPEARASALGPMPAERQLQRGYLVDPLTRAPLRLNGAVLTGSGAQTYRLLDGRIPVLVADPDQEAYASASPRMNEEYSSAHLRRRNSLPARIKAFLTQDYRTRASRQAFESLFTDLPEEALCLAIGGGPARAHPRLCNVNIGAFENVDVVADAHVLPYADGCVDAAHCEAVLEHLSDPARAVAEIFRVLKPGASAFFCTPFMQGYHGYPYHFQNFTLTGQQHLLRHAGFELIQAGVAVGPVYTFVSLVAGYLHEYAPRPLRFPLRTLWGGVGALLRPLDKWLATRDNAHVFASTTYVLVRKP